MTNRVSGAPAGALRGIPGGILDGIRVLELSQNAAIPHCGRLLAGLGADVVKVEPPGGDAMRGMAALGPLESRAFAVINPGKRSVAIDLNAADAGEVIDGLSAWADIALVAFKGSDLERYNIGWDHARTINPRLVHLTKLPVPDATDHNSTEFTEVVDQAERLFAGKTTAHWLEILGDVGYPCGPYNLPYEALEDPQVRANRYVVDLDHPIFGPYTTTGMPVSFEKAPSGITGPSPGFAVHTDEVLAEAGFEPSRIAQLIDWGVVLSNRP